MSTGDPNSVPLAPWQPEDRPVPTRWVGPYMLTPFGWRRLDGWTASSNPFASYEGGCDEEPAATAPVDGGGAPCVFADRPYFRWPPGGWL